MVPKATDGGLHESFDLGCDLVAISEQASIDVFLGLDVGKSGHNAVALNRAGKKLYDKALPQDETKSRDVRPANTPIPASGTELRKR